MRLAPDECMYSGSSHLQSASSPMILKLWMPSYSCKASADSCESSMHIGHRVRAHAYIDLLSACDLVCSPTLRLEGVLLLCL